MRIWQQSTSGKTFLGGKGPVSVSSAKTTDARSRRSVMQTVFNRAVYSWLTVSSMWYVTLIL